MTYVSSFLIDIGHGRLRWKVYISDVRDGASFVTVGRGDDDETLTEVMKKVLESHRLEQVRRNGTHIISPCKHMINIDQNGYYLETVSVEFSLSRC